MQINEKEIVIKDACLLIDLVDLNLMTEFFELNLTVITTIQVIGEITDEHQRIEVNKFIDNGKLQIESEGKLLIISAINDKYPGLSIADSSVLELAIRKEAIVLSSDGLIRKISLKENLCVRGLVWIIEELYNSNLINIEIALKKLEKYKKLNLRAPIKEIEALKNKLQS